MMQVQQPSSFGDIGSVGDVAGSLLPPPPESMDSSDYLSPVREEALQLLKPDVRQARILCLAVTGALALGFGLGWAGSSSWYGVPTVVASNPIAQKDTTSRRPELKANKIESGRKQMALGTSANAPKAQSLPTGALSRPDVESSRTAPAVSSADLTTASIPARDPLSPAPETRPTTIDGWMVRDVRGGAAVLEGPHGIWTVMVGDTVPGAGRVDSIVRWGNRWIVATANGLIASP
ncbi:hypothetical protein JQ628_18375 [Bradyrhizobium lablabi]|uniref:hypothetical protein n=1 Tax=Bradyrhizobium lablabi TaxID=722472 RepID=UPI001BA6D9FF|nr:hypothetical protein [Bradyrhizobium lablabi]MBR1123496.1 hypothetical protein [Bradyrhizobium lablabi]